MKSQHFLGKTALAFACALAFSQAALFAAKAHKTAEERGIIKSVDNAAHQIVVADQKTKAEKTFQWDDSTQFSEHRKKASSSTLETGMAVRISYAPSSGTPVMQRVALSPGKKRSARHAPLPSTEG